MRLYPRLLAYGIAVGSSAIAVLLSLSLETLISRTIGAFFYIAIIISTWYGGFRPGIVTVVLSTLAINYFFMPPRYKFSIEEPQDVLRLGIFLLVGLTINLVTSNLQHSRQKIKQLNQQLAQENAKQLRMALGAAQMGMWDWNIATAKIKWSPEHEQLFGLTIGSFDGKYETFDAHLHPDDRSSLNQAVEQAIQTHSIYHHEYRIIWADGSIHWVEGRGQVFYNEAGQPVRMTGTIMAIDERKQAQEKLEQQFEQQRLVMEITQRIRRSLNLQEILQNTVDEVRLFLGCDRVTIFQFSPDWSGTVVVESVGANWTAILSMQIHDPCFAKDYIEPFKSGLVTSKSDIYNAGIGCCHLELLASFQVKANLVVPILNKDELWGLLIAHHCTAPREWQSSEIELLRQLAAQVSIAIQQAALFEQVQTELAERKQMEVALLQSERRYRSLVHASSQIVWHTNTEGDTITTPEGWEELTGQSTGEYLEWGWFNVIHPEDRDRAFQSWQESYTNRTLYETEYRLLMKDGTYHDFAVRGVPILDGERKINEWIGTCTDITERKQAEQSLQEREAALHLFSQYAPAGIAMFDRDMHYLIASQRWVEDYHLDSVESLIGRSHYEVFPEISEQWRQIHQRCLAGASEKSDEDLFIRLDGTQQWIRWEIHPWHTAIGEIGGIIIFGENITQRKQTQIALQQLNAELEQRVVERTAQQRKTNDRLIETVRKQQQTQLVLLEQAQLLDLAHDTIITRDLNGAISFWNQGAEYMYGWMKAEALGQISHILLKSQFPQPLVEIEAELLEKGYWEGELTHSSRDDRSITVASRWVLQKDNAGTPIKILEINNDITERKQAEAVLKQYVHEVEDLYNNAPCGYHSLDGDGNFIRINDTELHWLGYTRDEILDKNFLDILTSKSKQVFQKSFPEFKQQGWVNNLEFEIVSKDGTIRWVSLNATAIKDEIGNFVMSRSTVFDISDRQRIEAAMRQYERIVSSTKDCIALLNNNYIYQVVNQAYLNWCNKPDTEVVGKSNRDVLGEKLFDSVIQDRLNRCLAGETIQHEQWFDYPNLVPQFMSVTYTPYRELGETITGVIVSLRDLTQLKEAEQMLELQAVIARNMAEGICLVRADNGIIVYANPKFEQMFGYDSGELNDRHVSIVNYESESVSAEDVTQAIRSAVLQKGESTYEVHNIKKDGTEFWCRATTSVFQHPKYGDVLVAVQQDITEQQAALRERQRIEAIMRQHERIVSSTKDGIALLNRNYIYQVVNQAYLDWCNKSDTEVVGKSKREVLGEKLFDNIIQARLDRCLAGETIQYEQWLDYPNPVPQFMSVTYTPYRELDETITGVIVSLRDLTQLKEAEQMLELQAVIARNMAEGICLVRADNGIIVYANPKFEQMFGYDSGELNGHEISIVNYESESVTAEDVYQGIQSTVLQKGEVTYEVHNVKKDGTPFWCRATTSVFQHPQYGDVLVAVQQDITEHKRIQDALRQSEEKFRQLAENIQAVFWMTDIQSQQFLYVSQVYETIWQRNCDNLYHNYSNWLDAIHPEDRSRVELELVEKVKRSQYDQKYRIIRPDGSIRWIRDRAFPIKNEMGEMVRIGGIAEDITEQEKIEQMKSEFIGIVSHELRTPLTSIRAAMGLLNSGIYAQKPEKSKRMIEIAAMESDRLVRLVNDILDLERLESGRAVLEKTTCQAADLIEQAVAGLQAIAKQQDIRFNIHPTDIQVWAAADAIIQTLTNLLGNALKFSPANSTITINVQQQTDRVLFQITDRGRGIPADKLEAIFGRFQQVDASDSRTKGGTGLGLAICRSIIDRHDGQIWVQSTVGVGSTFFFTLPMPGS